MQHQRRSEASKKTRDQRRSRRDLGGLHSLSSAFYESVGSYRCPEIYSLTFYMWCLMILHRQDLDREPSRPVEDLCFKITIISTEDAFEIWIEWHHD